ncbi:NYN domain-containing protein [Demetria terragena]|uniref:NYN domain-containing protein n=1 Tax=Demetria terragena TaxID=63959 RepID=UPI00036D503B|nr:NYN domain-containing protein [Demetria terragena]
MADPRVAVYIDFDNVVISRYDQVHAGRRDPWRADGARDHAPDETSSNPVAVRLAEAMVDIGAVLDYASSFGTVALARAYADWSVPANAAYRRQLVDRAVDLTQLFPVSGTKNGADIRLSIDAMEDLVHHEDLTHVVIVGGDSDYIALAQRTKQWGRFVVGIGVTGSTSRALVAACDEFSSYDALPGVREPGPVATRAVEPDPPAEQASTKQTAPAKKAASAKKTSARKTARKATSPTKAPEDPEVARQREATELLVRALQIAADRGDDDEWFFGGGVKSQMQRMDPGFKEKSLGFKTFSAFIASCPDLVETRGDGGDLQVRLVSR